MDGAALVAIAFIVGSTEGADEDEELDIAEAELEELDDDDAELSEDELESDSNSELELESESESECVGDGLGRGVRGFVIAGARVAGGVSFVSSRRDRFAGESTKRSAFS